MYRFSRTTAATRTIASVRTLGNFPRFAAVPRLAKLDTRVRFYSPQSLDTAAVNVSFDDVKNQLKAHDAVLIDVREPSEYAEGHIPGSINVPFRSSPGAFGLDDAEFHDAFGVEKPSKQSKLIFYCQGGVRSAGAEQLAATYGYQHRENYSGSFRDWTEHNGDVEKSDPKSETTESA